MCAARAAAFLDASAVLLVASAAVFSGGVDVQLPFAGIAASSRLAVVTL
jgi:hypothetical protein